MAQNLPFTEVAPAPILAGPIPPAKPLPYFPYLRVIRRNFIEALDESPAQEAGAKTA